MTINGFPVPTRHSQRREIDATAAADNADDALWLQAIRGKRARRDRASSRSDQHIRELEHDAEDSEAADEPTGLRGQCLVQAYFELEWWLWQGFG
ncbi:MAG: hypothetical protein C1943_14210 [Halochromatium sp.]|nr:hypothetical protein [Halochromatium sp.]